MKSVVRLDFLCLIYIKRKACWIVQNARFCGSCKEPAKKLYHMCEKCTTLFVKNQIISSRASGRKILKKTNKEEYHD